MKTREELESMTKPDIETYALDDLGVNVDGRMKKDKLVDLVVELQEQTNDPTTTSAVDVAKKSAGESVTVTVTDSPDSSGVTLRINGKAFILPLNKPVTIPSWVLPALADVSDVTFTQE